ncbi:MAG: hypothetical protein R6T98_08195, partial [Desulfatiglandales bacterium]
MKPRFLFLWLHEVVHRLSCDDEHRQVFQRSRVNLYEFFHLMLGRPGLVGLGYYGRIPRHDAGHDLLAQGAVGISTAAAISLAVDITRIPVYISSGFLPEELIIYIPFLFLIAVTGSFIGKKIVGKIPQRI